VTHVTAEHTASTSPIALTIDSLSHRYGEREVLRGFSLTVAAGEIVALLGPNGSGKTTLFRLLSTLVPHQAGQIAVFGHSLPQSAAAVRRMLGVVFQAPSVDKKLTVSENLWHHGRLFGLSSRELKSRVAMVLDRLRLTPQAHDRAQKLSGGQRRRVELAQCLLHAPPLLLLDEPSTGLDPGARVDLWRVLVELRDTAGTTVVLTTHLLDEAERADRIAILHQGQLVALDTPANLRASVGGDSITLQSSEPASLAERLTAEFGPDVRLVEGLVRLERPAAHELVPQIIDRYGDQIDSLTLGKPTLEDVFIDRTGHRFFGEATPA